jgi:hypothetical protein
MTISIDKKSLGFKNKNTDQDVLSQEQLSSINSLNPSLRKAKLIGVGGSQMMIPRPEYNKRDSDYVIETPNSNASIVIGRDRPSGLMSGYGGLGQQKCSTIDLVAGRVSAFSRTSFRDADENSEQKAFADPNFKYDASRIYISEKTDIDLNFKLVNTKFNTTPNIKGRAAIGIKSDLVRIIGDEGIKLVTGVYNEGDKTPAGIQLIAQNSDEGVLEVQPFVKGKNFFQSYFQLYQNVLIINGLLQEFINYQVSFNRVVEGHTHYSGAPGSPTTPPGLVTIESFAGISSRLKKQMEAIGRKLEQQTENLINWEQIWTNPKSETFLLSRFNGTN